VEESRDSAAFAETAAAFKLLAGETQADVGLCQNPFVTWENQKTDPDA